MNYRSGIGGWKIMNNYVASLRELAELGKQVGDNGRTPEELIQELAKLRSQNKRLRHQLIEMEHTADMDPLAPVYNRRAFIREVSRAQSVLDRYDITSAIIYLDLNCFKSVNDQFGHAIGDDIIREVGHVLKANTRECDMVARLGGDEFGVLLFKVTDSLARKKAVALCDRIADIRIDIPNADINVSASFGVSCCDTSLTAEQSLSMADKDMYRNKGKPAG